MIVVRDHLVYSGGALVCDVYRVRWILLFGFLPIFYQKSQVK